MLIRGDDDNDESVLILKGWGFSHFGDDNQRERDDEMFYN